MSNLLDAVDAALEALPLVPSDMAAVELARRQAAAIDTDPDTIAKIGPHLRETLAELGMTPRARLALFGENKVVGGKLAELRSIRP